MMTTTMSRRFTAVCSSSRARQWRRQSEHIKLIGNYFLKIFDVIIVVAAAATVNIMYVLLTRLKRKDIKLEYRMG